MITLTHKAVVVILERINLDCILIGDKCNDKRIFESSRYIIVI